MLLCNATKYLAFVSNVFFQSGWKVCYVSSLSALCFPSVALYAISAVYFAGVMVRLMLTLTPVVCMLSAIAFSSVFEHYLGDDTKKENPPAEDSSDEDDKRNSGNLYDKVTGLLNADCLPDGMHGHIIITFLWHATCTRPEVPSRFLIDLLQQDQRHLKVNLIVIILESGVWSTSLSDTALIIPHDNH